MPLSWVVIAARNLRVRHVTFQEFACIRTKNLIQSQACHSLCYVCGDVYVYGAPAITIKGRRKVCKYGGPISRTMYFELIGFCLHSGQDMGAECPLPPGKSGSDGSVIVPPSSLRRLIAAATAGQS